MTYKLFMCASYFIILSVMANLSLAQGVNDDDEDIVVFGLTKAQFVIILTFPCATLAGIIFCLCLTKSLGIPIWEEPATRKTAPQCHVHPHQKRKPIRKSPTNSRISSTSTATSSSFRNPSPC